LSKLTDIKKSDVVASSAFKTFKTGVGKLNDYLNKQQQQQQAASISNAAKPLQPSIRPVSTAPVVPSRVAKPIPIYKTPQYAKNYVSPYKQPGKK